jgi:hypothetical protein
MNTVWATQNLFMQSEEFYSFTDSLTDFTD